MEVPHAGELRPALVEFALDTEYRSLDEIKRSIELKEKLLSELSEETEISGYLLGSLGILYEQIAIYDRSIDCNRRALELAREIGDRRGEGNHLRNLGNAYGDLGQVEKAIEYYEDALVIVREIGDRRGEGAWLGNLGRTYSDLGQVEEAIAYFKYALAIGEEIKDPRIINFCKETLKSLKNSGD